jgi:hypothetical protein
LTVVGGLFFGLSQSSVTSAAVLTRTESFPSNGAGGPDASVEFVGINNPTFGFSDTSIAGGASGAGEAGGAFTRTGVTIAYADVDLGGTLGRNEDLKLSGNFMVTSDYTNFDGAMLIGYFNTADVNTVGAIPFIGVQLADVNRAFATITQSDGSFTNVLVPITVDTKYTFDLNYIANPLDGSGTLTGTLAGVPVSISAGASTDTFDAFGIATGWTPPAAPALRMDVYVDDLTYSVVPEPGSMGLSLVLGGLLVLRRRGRRRALAHDGAMTPQKT